MDLLPANLTDFADDEWDALVLAPEPDTYPDPDDPYYDDIAQTSHQIAVLRTEIPAKQLKVLPYIVQGVGPTEACAATGVSQQTYYKCKHNPIAQRIRTLSQRLNNLRNGPDQANRAAMLWRIAKRNEHEKPTVSLKAIDLLNKQDGVYQPDVSPASQGITVEHAVFHVTAHQDHIKEVNTIETTVRDGKFIPAEVDVSE